MRHFFRSVLLGAVAGFLLPADGLAQDKPPIKFGKIAPADFNLQSPLIDSSTSAVVVADVGTSEFIANTSELTFSLLFKRKKRIKILTKQGLDAATFEVGLYVGGSGAPERMEGLEAYTYNLVDGKVEETKLERSAVFTEKRNKNWQVKKFTMPAVQPGSIIEVMYNIKSDYFFNLQSWQFQGQFPILWSQYEAHIPEFYDYVTLSQGYHPFAVNTSTKGTVKYSFIAHNEVPQYGQGVSGNMNPFSIDGEVTRYTWVMKDVPALKEEPFTTTLANAVAKIEFQLKAIQFPRSPVRNVMNTWSRVTEELMADEDFGLQINGANNWLKDEVKSIVKDAVTSEEKVRKIFEHIRDHYTSNNEHRYRISTTLKDVLKNKGGSVADINMLLIAMIRNLDIQADPVLLSTRSNGYVSEYYPLMDRYNYLIARVLFEGKELFLDASSPRIGFNRLPLEVYNGQARIINKEAGTVYFMPDSLMEASNTMVFVEPDDKGNMTAFFTQNMGYYQSLRLRNRAIKIGLSGLEKEVADAMPEGCSFSGKAEFDSLMRPDDPVALKFEMRLEQFDGQERVYFNPMFGESIRKNPFIAAQRFYPVEMPYLFDDIYTLNLQIPKGYTIEELPKSARIMFNENEGMYEYLISADAQSVQMRRRLVMGKAVFPNEDYQSLRDFYGFMVNKEAEQIVFKKVK